jgi:hypothetical protein
MMPSRMKPLQQLQRQRQVNKLGTITLVACISLALGSWHSEVETRMLLSLIPALLLDNVLRKSSRRQHRLRSGSFLRAGRHQGHFGPGGVSAAVARSAQWRTHGTPHETTGTLFFCASSSVFCFDASPPKPAQDPLQQQPLQQQQPKPRPKPTLATVFWSIFGASHGCGAAAT